MSQKKQQKWATSGCLALNYTFWSIDGNGALTFEKCIPVVDELFKGLQFFHVFNFSSATRGHFSNITAPFSSIGCLPKSIIKVFERWFIMKQNVQKVLIFGSSLASILKCDIWSLLSDWSVFDTTRPDLKPFLDQVETEKAQWCRRHPNQIEGV